MSASIPIPTAQPSGDDRPQPRHRHHLRSMDATIGSPVTSSAMSPSSSSASFSSASPSTPSSLYSAATPSHRAKGKAVMSRSAPNPAPTRKEQRMAHNRRPSLLSSAISQEEAQFINIGEPDGPPRLISYLTSSQGFLWNPEIFVPSYVDFDYTPIENRREPIVEIFLSDEEIEKIYPK